AMIALAAAMRLQSPHGREQATQRYQFDVRPRWPLDTLMAGAGQA
ncbi:MAG: hypothetical protein RLZZ24_1310, partial [Pseudomonadota bacterium]